MIVTHVLKNDYRDSFFLMKLTNDLSNWTGVSNVMVAMGTDSNKHIFERVGLISDDIYKCSPNDLVISADINPKLNKDLFLKQLIDHIKSPGLIRQQNNRVENFSAFLQNNTQVTLVALSVAGQQAAILARQALENDRHVFCFSHHISIEDELSLKELARQRHLLMMGPDCGTAILDGIGLGFANQVRPGNIAVVGASGSGIQEVTSLIHKMGGGVAQAIGVGGRDLTTPIDGLMTMEAIRLVSGLPQVEVLVLLAKKISEAALLKVIEAARQTSLPVVAHFSKTHLLEPLFEKLVIAETYEVCAQKAVSVYNPFPNPLKPNHKLSVWVKKNLPTLSKQRRLVRGLFAGGSLCGETAEILIDKNIVLTTNLEKPFDEFPHDNVLVDLGAEEYTEGRPHPFIDHRLRSEEIKNAFADPKVGILVLDVVLGWGCHSDPAGEVVNALENAKEKFGSGPIVVASICGTEDDPQDYKKQLRLLKAHNVYVAESNAAAARFVAYLYMQLSETHTQKEITMPNVKLFEGVVSIVTIGLPIFEKSLKQQGHEVFSIEGRQLGKPSDEMSDLLDELL